MPRKREHGLSNTHKPDSLSIELSSLPATRPAVGPVPGMCVLIFQACVPTLAYFPCFGSQSEISISYILENTALNISVEGRGDWKESQNLSSAPVLFPAKQTRLNSLAGQRTEAISWSNMYRDIDEIWL
jgi:hypothetical protein